MMRSGKRVLYGLLILGQLLILVWPMVQDMRVDRLGQEVVLRLDREYPYSYGYRGSVLLHYEIERIPYTLWKENTPPKIGEYVYVLLEPRGGVHEAVGIFRERQKKDNEQIDLKGKITGFDRSYNHVLFLQYGPRRYESNALPEPGKADGKSYLVTLKVAPWGDGKIVGLRAARP